MDFNFLRNKRAGSVQTTLGFILGAIVLFVVIVALFQSKGNFNNFGGAISDSIKSVSGFFMGIFGPLFSFLIGNSSDSDVQFLRVLIFILVSIVIVGTLDSVNIFGEESGKFSLVNLAVGIIVSLIGIRFMPENLWEALTAPSTAFVATLVVGIPFLALVFVTMKIKFDLVRKLMWLFYVVFMSYIIFVRPGRSGGSSFQFMWVYLVFLVLGVLWMFFDATVISYVRQERAKATLARGVSQVTLVERARKQKELKDWIKLRDEYKKGTKEREDVESEIRNLKDEIAQLGKETGN